MLTLEQVREGLKDRRLRTVAEVTGLSYDTVWRVRNEQTKRVSYEVIKTLSDYLEPSNG